MKDNFITFGLIFIMILIIACVAILGINIYKDYIDVENISVAEEEFTGNITKINTQYENKDERENAEFETNDFKQEQSRDEQEQSIYEQEKDTIDNYFYNQLENPSKVIYKQFLEDKDNLKTGTYQIKFGNAFSDILSKENGQDILVDYYQSAIEAFLYDNPDIFYLDPQKMILNVETTTFKNKETYNVFLNSGDNSNYFADGFTSKAQIEQCERQIENVVNQVIPVAVGTTYEKVKRIHDVLINNISYDTTVSKDNIYNLYGALVNKECVCEGYAKAYKFLLNKVGISSVIVVGTATNSQGKTENHSWNYVEISGNWYAVDPTWDDPVIKGNGTVSEDAKYKYFLKGYNTINKDHVVSGQFTEGGKEFKYPPLSAVDY